MPQEILKILIVEDDKTRANFFRLWMSELDGFRPVIVKSAGVALGVLQRDKGHVYAGICLDHDLQQQAVTSSDRDLSGTTVVDRIIHYMSNDIPVLVHSMNPKRAPYMAHKLTEAGFYVTRIPMSDLTRTLFKNWLLEAREIWEDFKEEN